ncbi:uncharacterized protein, partial [Halyomorpha halys]|uniref:uncharacterized protein n=1 Tax=Halyomorpha halys TaxID=286706 RepID=UPI0034D30E41
MSNSQTVVKCGHVHVKQEEELLVPDDGMNSLGISIKEEVNAETEPDGANSFGIPIKEEVTDKTETNGISNLDVSIKEEMTIGTLQSSLSTIAVPTIDIKEERLEVYYGGHVHIKQEEELLVPDD